MIRRALSILLCAAAMSVAWVTTVAVPANAATVAYAVQDLGDGQLYSIDLTTGVATAIGPTGFDQIDGIAFSPAGVLYGIDVETDQLVTINTTTGAATAVGPLGFNVGDTGIAFDKDGTLFMATEGPSPTKLYRVNTATGAATEVGLQPQALSGLAITCAGEAFALGEDSDDIWSINLATGGGTKIGPTGGVQTSNADLSLAADGTLWALNDSGQLYTVDRATGAATVKFTLAAGFESLAIAPLACSAPEPPPEVLPAFTG